MYSTDYFYDTFETASEAAGALFIDDRCLPLSAKIYEDGVWKGDVVANYVAW